MGMGKVTKESRILATAVCTAVLLVHSWTCAQL